MPAKRLPWFKLWPEAIDHEKVAQLGDPEFRTWITILARAADQPIRWRFASMKHAAVASGRPLSHIRTLVNSRLMDDRGLDGLWVHDWKQWQERYASEFEDSVNAPPTLPDDPPNGTLNGRRTPAEGSANAAASPRAKRGEERVESRDVRPESEDERNETLPPASRGGRPRRKIREVDEEFRQRMIDEYAERLGSEEAVTIRIDAALGNKAADKYVDLQAYVRNWLRDDAEKLAARRRAAGIVLDPEPEPPPDDPRNLAPLPPRLVPGSITPVPHPTCEDCIVGRRHEHRPTSAA